MKLETMYGRLYRHFTCMLFSKLLQIISKAKESFIPLLFLAYVEPPYTFSPPIISFTTSMEDSSAQLGQKILLTLLVH